MSEVAHASKTARQSSGARRRRCFGEELSSTLRGRWKGVKVQGVEESVLEEKGDRDYRLSSMVSVDNFWLK